MKISNPVEYAEVLRLIRIAEEGERAQSKLIDILRKYNLKWSYEENKIILKEKQ